MVSVGPVTFSVGIPFDSLMILPRIPKLRKENDDGIALAKNVGIRATSDIFQPPWRF
jgi:hypothetical protein